MKQRAIYLALIIGYLIAINAMYLSKVGDGLSQYSDEYSESNSIRAGEGYADYGFLKHSGFPDYYYGDRFTGTGFKQEATDAEYVYTGYPPGADWLCGIYTCVFGKGNYRLFRLSSVALSILSSVFFIACLMTVLGTNKGAIAGGLFCLMPMFTRCGHGLYCWGYTFDLLLLQLGLLLISETKTANRSVWVLPFMWVIAFFQGWFSYDYFFLSTFSSVPVILLFSDRDLSEVIRRSLVLVIIVGSGFAAAHAIRFGMIIHLVGGIEPALADLSSRASKRYADQLLVEFNTNRFAYTIECLRDHMKAQITFTSLFAPWPLIITPVAFLVSLCRSGRLKMRLFYGRVFLVHARKRGLIAFILSGIISTGWVITMPFHAKPHVSWIGRHYFLFYFVAIVLILTSVKIKSKYLIGAKVPKLVAGPQT